MRRFRHLLLATLALTLVVIVFGAYVRLADAGLGCPDWPGCYGKLTPAHAAEHIHAAHAADPHGPVSMPKAWKEMIHRYLATGLGFLIITIALASWRYRQEPTSAPYTATALVGVVVFQGLLGMWTVTLLLKPAIVTAHLLGGLATLSLVAWLCLRAWRFPRVEAPPGLHALARIGLLLLLAQITLGGWTSTNYAALACPDFPTCHGSWWPETDFSNAFHVVRELGMTPEGEVLSLEAMNAIHWSHRLGAVVAGGALFLLAWLLSRRRATQGLGLALLMMVALQVLIGVANVVFGLPLALAVMHNAGAALLLLVMVAVNFQLVRVSVSARAGNAGSKHGKHENSFA